MSDLGKPLEGRRNVLERIMQELGIDREEEWSEA